MWEALFGDNKLLSVFSFVSYRIFVKFFFFLANFLKHDLADVI